MNKNISTWRGTDTPPTIFHLWVVENDLGEYIDTRIYINGTWISTKELYSSGPASETNLGGVKAWVTTQGNLNILNLSTE